MKFEWDEEKRHSNIAKRKANRREQEKYTKTIDARLGKN
jgi:uncharacterized DUF497 family protein